MKRYNHPMMFLDAEGGEGGGGEGAGQQQQQQQQAAAGDAWSWANSEGKLSDGWLDHLPEDIKPQGTALAGLVEKYQGSLPQILKGALHLQSIASKKIGSPSKEWSPEMVAEYRTAHGIPEKPEEYDISPDPTAIPEGFKWNGDVYKPLAKLAHDLNLPPAAMKQVAAQIMQIDKARQQAALQMVEEADNRTIEALKKEFGAENYEARLDRAARAGKVLGVDTNAETNPIANHPQFIKALDRMAEMMGESKLVNGATTPTATPGKQRAMDIMQGRDQQYSEDYAGKNGPERQQHAAKFVTDLLTHG